MNLIFKVQIFFQESHKQMRPDSEQSIAWLISKGFDARSSYFPDTFFVHYNANNENEKNIFRENLDLHLLAMSERNSSECALLITEEFLSHEEPPIQTWFLVPPSDLGMKYFKKFTEANPEFLIKLKELRLFYSQLESGTKLIYGLSLLEKWFDTKPNHCLTSKEQELIIKKIQELTLDKAKEGRVTKAIKDSNFFAEKNRNQRIAEAVQRYSGLNMKETENKIRELYEARAKSAHSTVDSELKESLNFLKSLFWNFLYREYDFIKLNLH